VLCQRAFSLLSEENALARAHLTFPQVMAYYAFANDAEATIDSGLQGGKLAREAGYTSLAIGAMGTTAYFMIAAGRLGEAHQLIQQSIHLGTQPGGFILPDVGWPMIWQAEILRERNQLDTAYALVEEAISLCQQTGSFVWSLYLVCAYATLAHICLSRGELDTARFALQQVERVGQNMNQPTYLYFRSLHAIVDQARLWLACGELDHATQWVQERDLVVRHSTPFTREREEVACVRILFATSQPATALQRLEPVLERATIGQRWNHVIEVRLLQALAYQKCGEETQALSVLSEAVRLAEPEGYICCFIDEGAPMAALLSRLQEQRREAGPTPYLDTVLAAFPRHSKTRKRQPKRDKTAVR
jgi:LuxR family maltose regulon positive regulatory protein